MFGGVLERRLFWNGQQRGLAGQGTVAEAAPACRMGDLVVLRRHFLHGHLPVVRGGLAQHQPGACAGGAQAVVVQRDAPRAVGILIAVLRVAVGLHHLHSRPVHVQLVGDDLRQRGADALPHLRAVRRNAHGAVRVQGEKQVRFQIARRHRLRLRRRRACRQAGAEDEDAGDAKEAAARDVGGGFAGRWGEIADRFHQALPSSARRLAASWMDERMRT